MPENLSPALAGLGLGIALAGAPGPVQAVLLTEALRGGATRGFRAMVGANLTLGVLLLAVALGVSVAVPGGPALRALKIVGGFLLIFFAVDGFRSSHELSTNTETQSTGLPPAARGALAVLLNPPAWLFLATAASSLMASATAAGGTGSAILAALALLAGVAASDGALVLAGGLGLRRAGAGNLDIGRQVRRVLAILLGVVGASLVINGVLS